VPPPLPLATAVERARTASPRLRSAAAIADAASDAQRLSGRPLNPVFELRTENLARATRTPSLPLDTFAVATQYVELGGKRGLRRQIAESDREVAAATLRALEHAVVIETVETYVRALRARALVDTLVTHRDGLSNLIAGMTRRVAEGHSAEADLLRFRTEAARIDGDISRSRLELERSLAALGFLIGAGEPLAAAALIEPAPLPVPAVETAAVGARVTAHPLVRAADADLARAARLTAAERARRYPDPAVSAGYKRTAGIDTLVVGVSLSVPLFDRNSAAIARAAGSERAARAVREATVFQLETDAASLIRAAGAMSAQAALADRELLAPAEQVRTSARAAFREGSSDVLKLIDAERVYADVRRAAIDLRLDAFAVTVAARFALGEEAIP
jgi:cobalt-zinc-cadmium efflux system outer membrane protein